MPITADHIRGLAAVQRGVLHRAKEAPHVKLGPLAVIHVDDAGWTSDGMARARRLLDDLLTHYAGLETDPPAIGYSRATRAAALRLYWGITEYPLSAQKTADAIAEVPGSGEMPSFETVYNWERAVVAESDVLKWINTEWSNVQIPEVPRPILWPRPAWGGSRRGWPEKRAWPPESTSGRNEGSALIDGAAAVRAADEPQLLQALREVVADQLQRYFDSPHHTRWYRHLHQRILVPWADHQTRGYLAPSVPIGAVADGGDLSQAVAIAAQMFFHDAVASTSPTRAALRKRIDAITQIDQVRDLATAAVTPLPPLPADYRASDDHELRRFRGSDLTVAKVTSYSVAGDATMHSLVNNLYELAVLVRASHPSVIPKLGRDYIARRQNVDWLDVSLADAIRLELADQSVHLDVARVDERELVEQLGVLIRTAGHSRAGAAYMVLTNREQALGHTKNLQHAEAVSRISQGFRELAYLRDNGFVEPKSALEAAHQLALSGAGAFVRLLEAQLRRTTRREPHGATREWARNALFLARMTRTRLSDLEGEGSGLTATRHQDNHISAVAWRVQTQIIALRVQLAVHTAVEANLCRALVRETGSATEDGYDLPALRSTYLNLVSTRELTAADAIEVVKLGMWLALLDSGEIPLAAKLAPALKKLEFIDRDPELIEHGSVTSRPADLLSASQWLRARNHDAGILTYLREDTRAAVLLDLRSNGLLSANRKTLPPPPPNLAPTR